MKKLLLTIIIFTTLSGISFADWTAKINAHGQEINGQYQASIKIGAGENGIKTPAPPKAPFYSCSLSILSLPEWTPYLIKDIRQNDITSNIWVIAVNPHGNAPGFDDSTTTLKWNPSEFGEGTFKLIQGLDENGEVLISDMKTVTSFDINGWDRDFYFTIIQE